MGKARIKVKDTDCKNWLDRKQSNKKQRQHSRKEEAEIILNFANKLISNSRDIDPEINRVVQKHFWDLV